MKILIVSATELEIKSCRDILSTKHQLEYLVTGTGMIATAYSVATRLKESKFDLAINIGIAGSFDRSILIGEVVCVINDMISELGAEDDKEFLNLTMLGLEGIDTFYVNTSDQFPVLNKFVKVSSITVNTVHGNDESILKVVKRLNPQIETMEGAAFFYVCEKENIAAIQLRSISNYVEKRNRDAWNIPLALVSLKQALSEVIAEI
jgi:futalosine hydrolase